MFLILVKKLITKYSGVTNQKTGFTTVDLIHYANIYVYVYTLTFLSGETRRLTLKRAMVANSLFAPRE